MTKPMNKIHDDLLENFKQEHPSNRSLDVYQVLATGSAIYPGQGTPLGLVYTALKLNGEAGEIAEHVGKALRDDDLIVPYRSDDVHQDLVINLEESSLRAHRKELIVKEVGDVLWYLAAICSELNITLSEAALINVQKLRDRQERGVLRGGGDER